MQLCVYGVDSTGGVSEISIVVMDSRMTPQTKNMVGYYFDNSEIFMDKNGNKFTMEVQKNFVYPLTSEELNSLKLTINEKSVEEFTSTPFL